MKKLIMVLLVAMLAAGTAFAGSEWYCQGELLVYGAAVEMGKNPGTQLRDRSGTDSSGFYYVVEFRADYEGRTLQALKYTFRRISGGVRISQTVGGITNDLGWFLR